MDGRHPENRRFPKVRLRVCNRAYRSLPATSRLLRATAVLQFVYLTHERQDECKYSLSNKTKLRNRSLDTNVAVNHVYARLHTSRRTLGNLRVLAWCAYPRLYPVYITWYCVVIATDNYGKDNKEKGIIANN